MSEELKKAYQEKTEAQMRQPAAKVEELKSKAASMGADAKVKALEKVEELKGQMEEGQKALQKLKDSTESNWDALKSTLEGITEGIKKIFDEMRSS